MQSVVHSQRGVTLVGGGDLSQEDLRTALSIAPDLVAADGGANFLMKLGYSPDAVIGDMDSLDPALLQGLGDRIHRIAEQDSTDFDKCLQRIAAPLVLALGFSGGRLDHTLAAMSSLVRFGSSRIVLVGQNDVCFLAPPALAVELPVGARVSLFPMSLVTGRSNGLNWPIEGIRFSPDGITGTSNHAIDGHVRLEFDNRGMIVLFDREVLSETIRALHAVADWR